MIESNQIDINALFDQVTPITDALNRGVRIALRRHKLLGQSIAVWRDGKAVVIPPEEIRIDDEPRTAEST